MIRLALAVVDMLTREGLVAILATCPHITLLGIATSHDDASLHACRPDVDVVLLDTTRYLSGVRIAQEMLLRRARGRPILFAADVHAYDAPTVLKAGIYGLLSLRATRATILEAIRTVSVGRPFIADTMGDMIYRTCLPTRATPAGLSPRELQVLKLLASGLRNTDVAAKLSLSVKTVSTHKRRIIERLSLRSDADLVLYAVAKNLIAAR